MTLDDREDRNIATELTNWGVPFGIARLDYGDLAIYSPSTGELIGFEHKRLTDLITCMQDRRLAGYQLASSGMRTAYDRVNLVIEGLWRPSSNGSIEVIGRSGWEPLYSPRGGGGVSYRQVDSFLESLTESGVRVWRTGSARETAQLYVSRYHWWQKDYDSHRSCNALYTVDPAAQHRGSIRVYNGTPSLVTKMAAQIPSIDSIAWDVGKHFATPFEMCVADVAEWRALPWTDSKGNVKHFGKDRAESIVAALQGNLLQGNKT